MSKVFEALQRLERDSGKPPSGILAEAQKVFQNGAPVRGAGAGIERESIEPESPDLETPEAIEQSEAPEPASRRNNSVFAFALDRIPVETAAITPECRIIYYSDPDSPGADRFRLLRMRLRPLWETGKLKTVLITSARAHDGKSTVSLNLATALAEEGQKRVLVVEGDLSHPSLRRRLGLPNREGLAECVEAGRDPLSLLRRIEPLGWYLLPAGRAQGNPAELLESPYVADVFEAVRPYFDWIVVDTPPVIPQTDTVSLKKYADAGLLVVRADSTPKEAVEAAIGRMGTQNLVGIVLNASVELDRLYSDYRKAYGPNSRR